LINATSPTSEDKARTRLVRWLRKRAETAGQWLFARDDLRAVHHGWQITTRCGGLGRQYRDPRFDTLRSCPDCAGSGTTGSGTTGSGTTGSGTTGSGTTGSGTTGSGTTSGEPCEACDATGRVTIPTSWTGGEVRPDDWDSFAPAE
jgi:hypothetical protein